MKVLAINSSPRMDKGNTALILNPFLEGMKEAGAEVELFYTRKLNINPCTGEFNCWLKTPGECYHNDDMKMILPKFVEADVIIIASPVYFFGITGPMKNLLDRLIPIARPSLVLRDGHTRHLSREKTKNRKCVLISNCGLWEKDNFDPLISYMEIFCKNTGSEFAGALLRPHGETMRGMLGMGVPIGDIFEAAKEAGRQLVKEQKISQETLDIVSRELLSREMYIQSGNQNFQQVPGELKK